MPKPDIKPDHIQGGFEWETAPSCKCGTVQRMLDARVLFAANASDMEGGGTVLYMYPLDSDGDIGVRKGLNVAYCPGCGTKIFSHKKYPLKT
jgi:hypothetical protein